MALLDGLFNRQQPATAPVAGLLAPQKSGLFGISSPTLMALGAGIASGDGIGDGIGKGLALASQTKQRETDREASLAPLRANYAALVQSGMKPQEALLQVTSPGTAKALDDRKRKSEWQQFLLGKPSAAPGTDFAANLRAAESGGDDTAKNPNSSATGRFQFTDGTWAGLQKNHPQLGLTDDGRTDPAQQEKALAALTAENATTLKNAGIPATAANLHGAHFLGGPTAAKVLAAPDDALISSFVGADAITANPFLQGMNVGDFKNWTAGKQGAQPVQVAQAPTGDIRDGLTNRQKTIAARLEPEKGLALIMDFQAENAAKAKTEAEKAKANGAMRTLLINQGVDEGQADTMINAGIAGDMVKAGMKPEKLPAPVQEYLFAVSKGFPGSILEYKQASRGKGLSIKTNPDGTMELVQGGSLSDAQQPTTKTTSDLQKSLVSAEETLALVKDLKEGFKTEYFTYAGAAKAGAARVADNTQGIPIVEDATRYLADKVGGDEKFLAERRAYLEQVAQSFNAYRKEITGAAAAVQELEDLKKATLNADLGPAEFKASLELLEKKVKRSRAIKRKLLREGISVGDPRFGPRFDQEYFAQGDGQQASAAPFGNDDIMKELQRRGGE